MLVLLAVRSQIPLNVLVDSDRPIGRAGDPQMVIPECRSSVERLSGSVMPTMLRNH